jgi:hypothetical protein
MRNGVKANQKRSVINILSLLLFLLPASSLADSGELTIALHGALGFDGGWKIDWNQSGPQTMPANLFEDEGGYEPTFGVGSFVDYGLSKNISLGLDVHFLWWKTGGGDHLTDRDGRLEFGPSVRLGFEAVESLYLYLRFSPGMTIVLYQDNWVGGATHRFAKNVGVMLEIGAIFHMFFGEVPLLSYIHYGVQPHLNCGLFLIF